LTTDEERPTGYVYTDVETTGLDPRRHLAYELSWALDDGPIYTVLLPHTLRYADPAALEVGRYFGRDIPGKLRARYDRPVHAELGDFVAAFNRPDGRKGTLVAANPAFDTSMLFGKVIGREPWTSRARRALRLPAPPAPAEPWAYRLLDIEAYAAGCFGWPKLGGLRTIREWLLTRGYAIPAPDHTAAGDVATLRAAHDACWDYIGKPYAADLAPRTNPRQVPSCDA
jgi:hypothetical protein